MQTTSVPERPSVVEETADYWQQSTKKMERSAESKLNIIIVGAGLGGLGAAIGCMLAGHSVEVLEAASQLNEVGAGIQVLPNSCRVLCRWGLKDALLQYAVKPTRVNMWGWKGNLISHLDYVETAKKYPGTEFWDFHRPALHKCMIDRVIELGGVIHTKSRVVDVQCAEDGSTASVTLHNGTKKTCDLVVGADGVFSKLRDIMLKRHDPPTPSGDMTYRMMLPAKKVLEDPILADFIKNPQVNYWLGPEVHCVNYVLRGGELFNFAVSSPDDIPPEAGHKVVVDKDEVREVFKGWDIRLRKLVELVDTVEKWRLCYRLGKGSWNHPSGSFTMLGDAVHAMVPYLASGAGLCLEDGAVLGECLSRITSKSPEQKRLALSVYETCRQDRTRRVVERGGLQKYMYHLRDGLEQVERDRIMNMDPTPPGETLVWRDPAMGPWLFGYDHIKDVEENWPKEAPALAELSSKL